MPKLTSQTVERYLPWFLALMVAVGIAAFIGAGVSASGQDRSGPLINGSTNPVESVTPGDGDEVLQQAVVGVDLDAAWEADLIIGGELIPPAELDANPATGSYSFSPGLSLIHI